MPKQIRIDEVFGALADPTRRAVVRRLCRAPASVSELARPFEMALPSFTQHLGVLESRGLVRSRKEGRARIYEISPLALKKAENWLGKQRQLWERRLDQMDSYVTELARDRKANKESI